MALGDIGTMLQNDLTGALGNIEKAALIFMEPSTDGPEKEDVAARGGDGSVPGLKLGGKSAENGLKGLKGKLKAVENAGKNFLKMTGNEGALTAYQKFAGENNWEREGKAFQFQFNPSSITLTARGGGRTEIRDHTGTDKKNADIYMGGVKPYITVSFQVIFDAENNADAFARDKFTLSATNAVKGGVALTRSLMGNEFTVRPFVEGFLAGMRGRERKKVVFQWGKMRYMGELSSVTGNYTMFSPSGNPIRAVVDIEITSANETDGKYDYLDHWQSRYNTILKDKTKGLMA